MADKVTPEDITKLREARGWSSARLAREIGCSQSTAWRMETEKLPISGMANKALLALMKEEVPAPASGGIERIKEAAEWVATEPFTLEQRKAVAPLLMDRFGLDAIQAEHAIAEAKLIWARAV